MDIRSVLINTLLGVVVASSAHAQTKQSIFVTASAEQKQSAKDFKPAPDKMKTPFGELAFEGGAFPTPQSAEKIFDAIDRQRATQAYMDFLPAISLYTIIKSQIRDFDLNTSSDIGVMADFMTASENYLTGNNITVYAFASLDLKVDGPTVVEIPPGMYGTANDAAFKYITDMGATGPDKGKGGKYLFLPPGYKGDIPKDHFVMHSNGYRIWAMMRGFGEVGNGDQAVAWFKKRLKIYPLAKGPVAGKAVNASGLGANTLPPEDGSYFTLLNEIIQHEPTSLFDAESLGRLATLGIEKGKPFNPDKRVQAIFDKSAQQGVAMSRAILYSSREPDINYWPERHWEKMFVRNTEFMVNGHNDIDARTLWHYQAIVVSPNLLSTTPGRGTAYLTSSKDSKGNFLVGDKNYRLRVPAKPPVKRFWAVTAYDPMSRSLLKSDGPINVGSLGKPDINKDGSVDIYFGSGKAPKGKEKNWIQTDSEKGFFVVFRFYGPEEGYIDKSWKLSDFELIE